MFCIKIERIIVLKTNSRIRLSFKILSVVLYSTFNWRIPTYTVRSHLRLLAQRTYAISYCLAMKQDYCKLYLNINVALRSSLD